MFEVFYQARYYILLAFWLALLGVGSWLRFRRLTADN